MPADSAAGPAAGGDADGRCRAWCSASATSCSSTTRPIRCNFLYGTLAILVLSTIVHYYTSSHLTAVTALKALDNEFESVSASLKVPFYKTFLRVTVPVCLPAILDIGRYHFVNAMMTISAVVFLYSPEDAARVDRDPQPRRGRRDRLGRGDGDADRRGVDRRAAVVYALVDALARHAHAGVAHAAPRCDSPTLLHRRKRHEPLIPAIRSCSRPAR